MLIANPIPSALHHYQGEVEYVLSNLKIGFDVLRVPSVERSGRSGALWRAAAALKTVLMRSSLSSAHVLALWPAFGVFDLLLWRLCRPRGRTTVIVHDATPLGGEMGYGRLSQSLIRLLGTGNRVSVLCHSSKAQQEIEEHYSVQAVVAEHPLRPHAPTAKPSNTSRVIRVLGQYKPVRDLKALELAQNFSTDGRYTFEVFGRGWPAIPGWHVYDEFVAEEKFISLIQTSDCIVIPYDRFYQSGVAVRALECGIPIVSIRHPQIEALYGVEWPGIVDSDWSDAVLRTLEDASVNMSQRLAEASKRSIESWRIAITQVSVAT